MRSLKEIQDKLKDVKKLRDQMEKPAADAALSVARAKDAHVHAMERDLHSKERAKSFERRIQKFSKHDAQVEAIDAQVKVLCNDWQAQEAAHKVNEKRLQDEKHAKHQEYAKHNKNVHILRGLERAHGLLKPEHLELLKVQAAKSVSAEVKSWLQ